MRKPKKKGKGIPNNGTYQLANAEEPNYQAAQRGGESQYQLHGGDMEHKYAVATDKFVKENGYSIANDGEPQYQTKDSVARGIRLVEPEYQTKDSVARTLGRPIGAKRPAKSNPTYNAATVDSTGNNESPYAYAENREGIYEPKTEQETYAYGDEPENTYALAQGTSDFGFQEPTYVFAKGQEPAYIRQGSKEEAT